MRKKYEKIIKKKFWKIGQKILETLLQRQKIQQTKATNISPYNEENMWVLGISEKHKGK